MCHYSFKARFIFPVDRAPIAEGVLSVEGHHITQVARRTKSAVWDLGNVAILPALVNVHTHLEFSHLPQPLGNPGMCFADWVRAVLANRQEATGPEQSGRLSGPSPVVRGLSESLQTGSVTLGEVANTAWNEKDFEQVCPTGTIFFELIGLSETRIQELISTVLELIAAAKQAPTRWQIGFSPHAPYTASGSLITQVAKLAAIHKFSLAMHLAETRAEIDFLREGRGPLRELLEERGVWNSTCFQHPLRALDYLKILAEAPRALIVHGNYLDQEELQFLAKHSETMTLVYCPRTHAYFGHSPYPLFQALQSGVHVALGTDSNASNPDLNLLTDMRFARQQHPAVTGDQILRMGTLHGAQALSAADRLGSLSVGKRASWIAVELPERDDPDPHDLVFQSLLPVSLVVVDGKPVYAQGKMGAFLKKWREEAGTG
ncbi:MAG: hypothetical protein CMJ81_18980 [Planctomycetaceae bacterium]|nr:hypothetical protein [Planctomycetaceae bacterium]